MQTRILKITHQHKVEHNLNLNCLSIFLAFYRLGHWSLSTCQSSQTNLKGTKEKFHIALVLFCILIGTLNYNLYPGEDKFQYQYLNKYWQKGGIFEYLCVQKQVKETSTSNFIFLIDFEPYFHSQNNLAEIMPYCILHAALFPRGFESSFTHYLIISAFLRLVSSATFLTPGKTSW